jgi:hypothetical protein
LSLSCRMLALFPGSTMDVASAVTSVLTFRPPLIHPAYPLLELPWIATVVLTSPAVRMIPGSALVLSGSAQSRESRTSTWGSLLVLVSVESIIRLVCDSPAKTCLQAVYTFFSRLQCSGADRSYHVRVTAGCHVGVRRKTLDLVMCERRKTRTVGIVRDLQTRTWTTCWHYGSSSFVRNKRLASGNTSRSSSMMLC